MPTFPTHVDTVALSRRLNSSEETERRQAQADLNALIARDVRRIRQCRRLKTVACMIAICICPIASSIAAPLNSYLLALTMPVVVITCIALFIFADFRAADAIKHISDLDVPQVIGALLEVCSSRGWFVVGNISPALIRLLPRLQATDADNLTSYQRKVLYALLYKGTGVTIAILRALEQIGDENAIPHVEKLAHSRWDTQVKAAAQECLPFLQQRAEQTRVEQTLLRASTPTTPPDMLLRPTVATVPTEPQQLLRASHTEGDKYES